ncbi:hypothetical protein D0U04_27455 [Bacillus clarus]|uniref:Uncharacterized protein n=1 Tax=Bacillus clarus TaxID=2338372 RepID=A0A090Y9S2_9BACI|nr:hypothetical protein [Bacillus clarus]KFM95229.1 hypothetical protein DJ93_5883 [Bacillus clarus]RFT62685.1 hypothetical protein D0U04_27455 [Bacillus clarus]
MKWGIEAIKNTEVNGTDIYKNLNIGEGYQSTSWTYLSLSYLQDFFESSGLSRDTILELLPISFKGIIWNFLEDEDVEFIRALTNPKRCLEILEEFSLMEAAVTYEPSMEFKLGWLKERWEKGYYVFANG